MGNGKGGEGGREPTGGKCQWKMLSINGARAFVSHLLCLDLGREFPQYDKHSLLSPCHCPFIWIYLSASPIAPPFPDAMLINNNIIYNNNMILWRLAGWAPGVPGETGGAGSRGQKLSCPLKWLYPYTPKPWNCHILSLHAVSEKRYVKLLTYCVWNISNHVDTLFEAFLCRPRFALIH